MLDKDLQRIKISQVIDSQLPAFILEENPLFSEFLKQYYISQNGVIELAENIDRYVNLENFDTSKFTEYSSTLLSNIEYYDDVIEIQSTASWPDSYGLLKIDDEIITYLSKDDTHFYDCVRGFSGITSLHDELNPNELVFSSTEAASHINGAKVENLSNIVFVEIWKKLKYQFLPGFEDININENVDKKLLLTRIKDFYNSKGSLESFKILFKALYGEPNLKVVNPSEYLIKGSSANFSITNNLIVETIYGDITKINGQPIIQESPYAYGNVYLSTLISNEDRPYYEIVLSNDTKIGKFKACPVTRLTSEASVGDTILTVDSTIGFTNSGEIYVNDQYITYDGKNDNQFFNCNIENDISLYSDVYQNYFVYSYEDGDVNKPVYMRVTSVLSDTSNIVGNSKYLKVGDEIAVKTLGEDVEPDEEIYNNRTKNWFYNNTYEIEVVTSPSGITQTTSPATINTKVEHGFKLNDNITLIDVDVNDTSINSPVVGKVSQVYSETSFAFEYTSGILSSNLEYKIRKNIKFASSTSEKYIADIQNSYVDPTKENIYVSTTSLPSYSVQVGLGKVFFSIGLFETELITTTNSSGSLTNHNLQTGDKIYYEYNGANVGLNTGTYYVKKINDTQLKLSYNASKIYKNDYITFTPTGSPNAITNSLILEELANKEITDQQLIKRFSINPSPKNSNFNLTESPLLTPVGMLLNGTEIVYSKSSDKIYYGKLTSIDLLNGGHDYDVINPPNVIFEDSIGYGASAIVHVEGSLSEVKLLSSGFNYTKAPTIKIYGGNGSGASAEAIMEDVFTSVNFSGNSIGINTTLNSIGFSTYHNFKTGEEIIYRSYTNTGIGIGTYGVPAAGESDTKNYLIDLSHYYIIAVDEYAVRLANTYNDAIAGINTINFTQISSGNHTLISAKSKKVLNKINVTNSGSGYVNKKIIVSSTSYPVKNVVDIKTTLVGINTQENYIYAKNHNFQEKELINYIATGTPITGLSTSLDYYVLKLDNDKFRLASAGIGTTSTTANYDQNKYVKFSNFGTGSHNFYTPPIVLEILGTPNSSDISGLPANVGDNSQFSHATAVPVFTGTITNAFLYDTGSNYGTPDILNYNRKPILTVNSGSGAILQPIIVNGGISDVYILNGGSGYVSPPEIKVFGDGVFANLLAVINNGKIIDVKVIDSGKNYNKNNTELIAVTKGGGASIIANIQTWHVNLYKKYETVINDILNKSDSFFIKSFNKNVNTAQLVSPIVPKQLRYLLGDNLDANLNTVPNIQHSPIVGWAYDGNPIYGPYGSKNSLSISQISELRSGYEFINHPQRPSYPSGFFVEDYEYTANGDLDEFNGRYCITPEFPQGTYAYFSTKNNYPYVIANFAYEVDRYNLNYTKTQLNNAVENDNLIRNTSPYKLNKEYSKYYGLNLNYSKKAKSLVRAVVAAGVDEIKIVNSGNSYKVNDRIVFDNTQTNGRGLDAKITSIVGKGVSSVTSSKIYYDNVEFVQQDNNILGIFTSPHNINDGQIITVSGINTASYKFIEGKFNAGILTSFSKVLTSIGTTATTGISTEIILTDPPNRKILNPDDLIVINNEKILILGDNALRTGYRVLRCYDSSTGGIHTAGETVQLLSKILSFPTKSGIKTESTTKLNSTKYFNPQTDVGIGATTTIVQVGYGFTQSPIGITTGFGSYTIIEFYQNPFKVGDIVKLDYAQNITFSNATVVSKTPTTITINYDSTSNSNISLGTTSIVTQQKRVLINPSSIYIRNHGYSTGQKLKYSVTSGIGLTCSTNQSLTPKFTLNSGSYIYAIVDDSNFIGITTTLVGIQSAQNRLYFTSKSTQTGQSHKFETTYQNPKGEVILNQGTITTFEDHGISYNDIFTLNIIPNLTETVTLKFDNSSARLLINPIGFGSTQVSVENNTVTLYNHNFNTGDKVVYNSYNSINPLLDGEEYFIIKVNENSIKFAEYIYDTNDLNYTGINLTSTGIGTQTISPINPPLKFTLGNTIKFDIKDVSLSSLVLNFYTDNSFTNKIISNNIQRIGIPGDQNATTSVNLKLDTNLPEKIYYKLTPVGITSITNNAYAYNVDYDVRAYCQITAVPTNFNGIYKAVSVGSTSINFDILNDTEVSSYTNIGITTFSYITNSKTANGPIDKISIGFTGTGYKSIPGVSTITSESGVDSLLKVFSYDIGKIKNINIINSGYNFPTDPSLKPKADVPFVAKVKNNYQLKDIIILDSGKNYLVEPKLICIEHPEIVFETQLESNSVKSASVKINKTGLSEVPPTIISVNNSNGVQIIDAFSDGQTNTLKINSNNGSFIEFPFKVDDSIFIEGVETTQPLAFSGGYNSENYNYSYFKVTSIDDTPGDESISYSIIGIGTTGGYFDSANSVGRVIKYDDLAKFTTSLEKTDFHDNELIYSNGSVFKVYNEGWNRDKGILKITGNSFNISVGSTIVGTKSGSKATVEEISYTDSYYNCFGEFIKENGWKDEVGFTNTRDQRIFDSNYYQNFSYALNSQIQKDDWFDAVQSLAHPSGYKAFGDIVLDSKPTLGIGRSNNLKIKPTQVSDTLINLSSFGSFNTKQYFDSSYEVTTNKGISKDVGFLTKKLIDYSVCRSNKVLKIDNISNQFNGTSTLEVDGRYADGGNLLLLNRQFIQSEVVGFITSTYPSILSNLDFNSDICKRDVGYIVDSISYDLKYGGNEKSVAAGLAYWSGIGGTSYVSGESVETIGGFRYIVDLSRYIINNVAITTTYQTQVSQSFNYNIIVDESCNPSYSANCCANVISAIGSYVGIITSIIGIGTTASPNVTIADVSKGGTIVGLSSFFLNNGNQRLLSKSFIAQNACSIGSSIITITNHNFNSGEQLNYIPGNGGTSIAIQSTNRVIGGATTNLMPNTVYAYKIDNNRIKLAGLSTDAVAGGNYFTFRDIGSGLGVGAGTTHKLYVPSDSANTRAIITIDNIIQSPVYKKKVSTSLSNAVSLGSTIVTLTGITSITNSNLLRIDDEIMKINFVGFGSTNVLSVQRGSMGSVAAAHTIGAGVTVLNGDYNISNGTIYFTTPPYGVVGSPGISTNSTFSGRVFYRLNYKTNYIFDDISNKFNGSNSKFELLSYGADVTGIITDIGNNLTGPNYGIISINNILQKPSIDYTMTERTAIGIGGSIAFTGTNELDLPNGGIIDSANIGFGSGYQPLVQAFAIPVISGGGTIQSLTLTSSGFGYRNNVSVKINSQVGSGASIVALVGTGSSVGIITGFNIISGGSGYASTNPPNTIVGVPTAYSNIPLLGGSGSGAKLNIIVGSGGSVTQFEFSNRGIGYKIGDNLTINKIPTVVGIATSGFTLTITSTVNDKFYGWHFGNLTLLDDISSQFNGRSKSFLLTRTDFITERYNISALPGSGIDVENNLIIILNDVIQHPGENYILTGGERIVFNTPPPSGSKCLIFFYKGSPSDVIDVNISPEIKPGDSLRLLKKLPYAEQIGRVATNILSISEIKTTNYIDVGISTDASFYRPISLDKQKSDLIIDNVYISKARALYEGKFIPTTRLIKNVYTTDTVVYVESAYPNFRQLDDLDQIKNSIVIFNDIDSKTSKITANVSVAGTVTNYSIIDGGNGYSSNPSITVSSTFPIIPQYGKTWSSNIIKTGSDTFKDFDFGNGLYVACSDSGNISTSINFTDWQTQSSLGVAGFNGVKYGSNSWVIVGSGSSIFASSNGKTWVHVNKFLSRVYAGGIVPFEYPSATYTGTPKSVAFRENKFIIVGTGGTALVSNVTSGISTSCIVRSTPLPTDLNSITSGFDNYVAVGNAGYIVRSSDGYVWTKQTSNTTNKLNSVRYLQNKYFAVGDSGTILVSYDGGGEWIVVSEPEFSSYNLYDISYKNEVYLITGSSNLTLVSINGEDWIRTTNSSTTISRLGTSLYNIIGVGQSASYALTDSEIVKATVTSNISIGGTIQSINVVDPGFGYNVNTPITVLVSPPITTSEKFDNVEIAGDYGTIVGISTNSVGISTTSPMIIFNFDSDKALNTANYGNITKSGISTGDYFIINNTIVGKGVTTLNSDSGYSILGIGSTFIDNVYRADQVVTSSSGIVTVYSNVQSITSIASTSGLTCGYYSWGKLYNFNSRSNPLQFSVVNTGLIGISTAPLVFRKNPLLVNY